MSEAAQVWEQVNSLIYFMGDQADDILLSFGLSSDDQKKFDTVLAKFEAHFIVKRNTIYERSRFNSRVQENGESVDEFITSLYSLSEYCEYGQLKDELIRDRIVVGVRDRHLAEKMQLDESLTLEKAVKMSRQHETVKRQQRDLRGETTTTTNLARVGAKPEKQKKPNSKTKSVKSSPSDSSKNCKFCGRTHEMKKEVCPAWGKDCKTCGKKNHFSKLCKSKEGTVKVNYVDGEVRDREGGFVGSIRTIGFLETAQSRDSRWSSLVKVDNTEILFKLDPGADVTVLPLTLFRQKWKSRQLDHPTRSLNGPDGSSLNSVGSFMCELSHGNLKVSETVYVIRGLQRPLLGLQACEDLSLVRRVDRVWNDEVPKSAENPAHVEKEFPMLFSGLGKIDHPYTIKLKPDAVPYAIHCPRRVPLPLMDKLKEKIDEFLRDDVIEPVDEPTEWCAPVVIAPKSNGDIRVCVDLTKLNRNVEREFHMMPVVEHTLGQISGVKYFTKLDANSGFFQIVLSPESRRLTTFLTPFGRYCYKRLPFGITSAPEVYQKRMSEILRGRICVVHHDDILVWGKTMEEHDARLRDVLKRLRDAGVTLNPAKCEFGVTTVKFLGHLLDENGIRPDPAKVEGIAKMSRPTDVPGVRRFMGMANYLGRFVPRMADVSQPLNDLLRAKNEFVWGPTQEKAFQKIKKILTEEPVLALFDVKKETVVSADSSSYGMGACLLQRQDDGELRPISYASRTLSDAEQRYGQIEKEALASTWGCERFRDFLAGSHFLIETDHKPLLQILVSKNLDDLSPRLQCFRLRLMRYSYDVKYVPGKLLYTADTLSRQPLDHKGDVEFEEVLAHVCHIISQLPVRDEFLSRIWKAQTEDSLLKEVSLLCNQGWPEKTPVNADLKKFWNSRYELSVSNGLLMKGCRLVLPSSMQEELLGRLHAGHMGVVKCRARARESVWWPGISEEIAEVVRKCPICVKERGERHEPLIPSEFPSRPWQRVAMDLFKSHGKWFIIITDYYSRYPEVYQLLNQTATCVINCCKAVFSRHGVPEEVMSDNGPQFAPVDSSEFRKFSREWGFIATTSSPRYPQSNGFVEAGVKIVKNLLKKNSDWYAALLEYRATPLANGYSPSDLLMSRRIRSLLPMNPTRLVPISVDKEDLNSKEELRRSRQKKDYDSHHRVQPKEDLQPEENANAPRSLIVDTPRGKFRRNSLALTRAHTNDLPEPPAPDLDCPSQSFVDGQNTKDPPEQNQDRRPRDQVSRNDGNYVTRSGRVVKPVQRLLCEK
ncbi:Transposon Tf2-6 polyprotein [Folsomia candida]|uniref:RNA-directed DNA polymerase n=1 Tax=Folsomia candida TaxID=158441 RepID=A0A226E9P4_FOLCA|nr:Transposon Tf2-6 polyprotein [Folsomia candida]